MNPPIEVVVTAIFKIAMYLGVLLVGFKMWRRHWPIGLACALAIAANVCILLELQKVQGGVGVFFAGVTAWIYIDRMRNDPHTVRSQWGVESAKWSHERHDLLNRVHVAEMTSELYRRKYGDLK